MPSIVRKWLPLILFSLIVIVLDRLAKNWIIEHVPLGETLLLFPSLHPYLQITHTTNSGIAFGIGIGGNNLALLLSIIIVIGLLIYYTRIPQQTLIQPVGLGLVIGGALGNVTDRVLYGAVVDFVHVVIPGLVSNVSNFADHAIVIGVGCMLLDAWLQDRHEKNAASTSANDLT
jgi:signal peptidase II